MSSTRIRRKDLKQPDEFVHVGQQLLHWAQTHRQRVVQGAIAVVAVLLLVGLANVYRRANVQRANEMLAQGLSDFRTSQWDRAGDSLSKVASAWPSSSPGQLAALVAAQADIRTGRLERVATHLANPENFARLAPYLAQQATLAKALAEEKAGRFAEAATLAERAATLQGPYAASALYEAGRLYLRAGNSAKAKELYERLTREFPSAPEAEWAKKLGAETLPSASTTS